MKANEEHIDFFNQLETPYGKDKDELWNQIENQLEDDKDAKYFKLSPVVWTIAAISLILITTGLFMKLYTVEINTLRGEYKIHQLPDGSISTLNAQSSIEYQPFWWWMERKLILSGEAFFEAEKGNKFRIHSEEGITEVLGTSFNIYARDGHYEVFCQSGQVRVSSTRTDIEFIIQPNELASIDNSNQEGYKSNANETDFIAWKEQKFNFFNAPLSQVFKELELRYAVTIKVQDESILQQEFTGYFDKPTSPEEALHLICTTFHLTFVKENSITYQVYFKTH